MAKKTPKSSTRGENPGPKRSKASPKKAGAKGKSAPVRKASPKKAMAKKSAVEKYRDIDRSSVSTLILSSVVRTPGGISDTELKDQLTSRFADAIDANIKHLKSDKTIKTEDGRLALAGGQDLIRKVVCVALCSRPGQAMSESEVIAQIPTQFQITDEDVRLALDSLSQGSGKCVKDLGGRQFLRDCTKTCPCD